MKTLNTEFYKVSEEVSSALEHKKAVVALESTIISHGMPYPQNVETALEVENIIRSEGVVPATIGILGGKIHVGMTGDDIEKLGKSDNVKKVSRRDITGVLLSGGHGATTVAATMLIAEKAGISVFATGGIGGVHRGFGQTGDVSADLIELSKTNVAVICAGIKSILDLPATMEYLETHSVPVLGFQSDELAAFYSSESGIKLHERFDQPEDIADYLKLKWKLPLYGGVVISNPIPKEMEIEKSAIDKVINKALEEYEELGVQGKEITPFLLEKVKKLTSGKSLEANIALIKNNAELASKIAIAMAR